MCIFASNLQAHRGSTKKQNEKNSITHIIDCHDGKHS